MNSLSQHLTMQLRFLVALTLLLTSSTLYADVPTKFSMLQDWKGVKIITSKSESCPNCCNIIFPGSFAATDENEFNELLTIIRGQQPRERDMKCTANPRDDALNHLVLLASTLQNARAAELIINVNASTNLNLDKEATERFAVAQQLPVLMGYKKARTLLSSKPGLEAILSERLVQDLCSKWDFKADKEIREQLPSNLEKNGLIKMAMKFNAQCSPATGKR